MLAHAKLHFMILHLLCFMFSENRLSPNAEPQVMWQRSVLLLVNPVLVEHLVSMTSDFFFLHYLFVPLYTIKTDPVTFFCHDSGLSGGL